ncbi:hypothetical protein Bcsk_003540 [Bartonella sp. CDC_skunk]|uniref:Uncharacterized protein n=1 Tax=Bartonella rochalimae ATCC BAA-1498 TaxID=685782 RepID=A0A067WJX8_9HYPH|nr:hypothetical protein BA1379B_002360 [Bartonella sp. A1379B]AQX21014.1 hypothetical protein Bcsk_003540 [Bartonella sp. CDC_skunk]AQX22597.1 hypothetical protein Bho11B_005750 [Bartonella sp. 11B]AQX24120.1 hypothetical protein Bho114_008010 [Bartonella sp. 114]AQX25046.1 hypothetical protein Bco22_003490 [Bartonella sp. Coyote22sub2]AQX26272.1 hypothetical protein Bra60_002500 [Bartonella sp. Raccoon60]KEC56232.1 hypothetical protein O99_00549 [Bartonella rochalimae ATCC BAA-1498]
MGFGSNDKSNLSGYVQLFSNILLQSSLVST